MMRYSCQIIMLLCLSFCSLISSTLHATQIPDLQGAWGGTMQVGSNTLRLRFNLVPQSDGQYSATFDSIDQGASGIPVNHVSFTEKQLKLEITAAQAVYLGDYQVSPEQIEGQWQQGPHSFSLTLKRQQQERKPQEPIAPYPYLEEQVTFHNETAGIWLAGTLTRPASSNKAVPVVVLISGSGPQDRDHQVMGHRPFLVLADFLTRQGFAVLRFDDRGIGQSEGNFYQATSIDFATDVAAAVRYLQQRPEIQQNQIGLLGHSEGGLIAPMVAKQQAGVGFLVLLAAPGLVGAEISASQFRRIMQAQGLPDDTVLAATELYRSMNALSATEPAPDRATLEAYYQQHWQAMPVSIRQQLSQLGGGHLSAERLAELQNPWFRYFQRHNPQIWLQQNRLPTLVAHGNKDFQLDADSNINAIEQALQQANNQQYQILRFDGLNHLFQEAQSGSFDEYATLEQTLSPKLLNALADWLHQITVNSEPLTSTTAK